jgi:hypothetical protein
VKEGVPFRKRKRRWEYNIKMNMKAGCGLDSCSSEYCQILSFLNTVMSCWA